MTSTFTLETRKKIKHKLIRKKETVKIEINEIKTGKQRENL